MGTRNQTGQDESTRRDETEGHIAKQPPPSEAIISGRYREDNDDNNFLSQGNGDGPPSPILAHGGNGGPIDEEDGKGFDLRRNAGRVMHRVSDVINDNIVVARYGTMATIALLAGYGVYRTPLFFRYRAVSEIPPDLFERRSTLHGRIVRILEEEALVGKATGEKERPIKCLVRHLSPIGRLQSRAAFDFSSKNSPSARHAGRPEKSKDLLKIEIAGLKVPPRYSNSAEQQGQWLHRLASERTPVTCQLLSRRTPDKPSNKKGMANLLSGAKSDFSDGPADPLSEQFAVCHLKYRPPRSLFRQDLALTLIQNGRANVASGIHAEDPSRPTVDGSTRVEDIGKDAQYMEKLAKAEFDAVKNRRGMWDDDFVRKNHPDLVQEADFEAKASVGQKLWRWIREKTGF